MRVYVQKWLGFLRKVEIVCASVEIPMKKSGFSAAMYGIVAIFVFQTQIWTL